MLFSMLLKKDLVDIGKPDGICSLTFDIDEFSELIYVNQSFLYCTQDLHK